MNLRKSPSTFDVKEFPTANAAIEEVIKGGPATALRVAKDRASLCTAAESFFLATSMRDATDAFVIVLVNAIWGEWRTPPLDFNMMLSVAAAVNQAKFRIFQNQARDRYRQLAVAY